MIHATQHRVALIRSAKYNEIRLFVNVCLAFLAIHKVRVVVRNVHSAQTVPKIRLVSMLNVSIHVPASAVMAHSARPPITIQYAVAPVQWLAIRSLNVMCHRNR